MSKMSSLIGPELQCHQVSYLFHFGFLGPHYFLQEILDTTLSRRFRRIIGPSLLFTGGFLDPWDMQDLYCNQIRICTWHTASLHPLVEIILDHGSQTSTHCFFKTHFFKKNFFLDKSPIRNINNKMIRCTNPHVEIILDHRRPRSSPIFADVIATHFCQRDN